MGSLKVGLNILAGSNQIANKVTDDLSPIFKALSDSTRRQILDFLKGKSRLTGEIVDQFPGLTRFGVMKHVDVPREAGLIVTRHEGRHRINSLGAVSIRLIYERWLHLFSDYWATALLSVKQSAETGSPSGKVTPSER